MLQHCRQHALGNGKEAPAPGKDGVISWSDACLPRCDHVHDLSCDSCAELAILQEETLRLIKKVGGLKK